MHATKMFARNILKILVSIPYMCSAIARGID